MGGRKPFLLRVDAGLLAELEAWAQEDLRSVNGQIEYLLRQALLRRRGLRPSPPLTTAQPPGPGAKEGPTAGSETQ